MFEKHLLAVMLRDILSGDVFGYFTGKKYLIPNNLVLFGLLCGVLKCQESRVFVANDGPAFWMEIPTNQSFVHVEQLELRAGGTGKGKSSGGLS